MKYTRLPMLVMLVALVALAQISNCAAKPAVGARKEDVPYIKCQVCEKLAVQLHRQVDKRRLQISPKMVSEYEIIEITENICNLKKQEADWILRIDIVEQGDKLELVEQDAEGQCNSECKTIERACQEVIGYSDTDVAEYVYTSKPDIQSLTNYLCKDLTRACSKKPPPLPKDRVPGEPFMPKPEKEAEMERLLKSMEGMPGAPGMKMYSREDLMKGKLGDEDDEDEDEDEDDTSLSSNLKTIMKEKAGKKEDWKKTVSKGIKATSETLKRHTFRLASKMKRWWRDMKSSSTSKKPKAEL